MITLAELQSEVRQNLYSFVDCVVNFETVEDDPRMVGVGVYGVKDALVSAVENKILDLDAKFCAVGEFTLIPFVQNQKTTDMYYPQFSKGWQSTTPLAVSATLIRLAGEDAPMEFLAEVQENSSWTRASEYVHSAANHELALAA